MTRCEHKIQFRGIPTSTSLTYKLLKCGSFVVTALPIFFQVPDTFFITNQNFQYEEATDLPTFSQTCNGAEPYIFALDNYIILQLHNT